jgi:hypothetical protein
MRKIFIILAILPLQLLLLSDIGALTVEKPDERTEFSFETMLFINLNKFHGQRVYDDEAIIVIKIKTEFDREYEQQYLSFARILHSEFVIQMKDRGWADYVNIWKRNNPYQYHWIWREYYNKYVNDTETDIGLSIDSRPVLKVHNALKRHEGLADVSYKFRGDLDSDREIRDFFSRIIEDKIIPTIKYQIQFLK